MARNSSLRFDAATPATTASCFSPSTGLTSRISGSKWREQTCSLFCICVVHSFTLIVVFTTLSFGFILLFSHLASLISSFVQYDDGAHKTERARQQRRLRASCCPTSDTGHDNKASSFPETKNGLVFLCRCPASSRLVPVLAGKDPIKVGCSGVGGLARFQNFPGYTWIRRMRVQTESCC